MKNYKLISPLDLKPHLNDGWDFKKQLSDGQILITKSTDLYMGFDVGDDATIDLVQFMQMLSPQIAYDDFFVTMHSDGSGEIVIEGVCVFDFDSLQRLTRLFK